MPTILAVCHDRSQRLDGRFKELREEILTSSRCLKLPGHPHHILQNGRKKLQPRKHGLRYVREISASDTDNASIIGSGFD